MTEYPSDPVYLNLTLNQTLVKIGLNFGVQPSDVGFRNRVPAKFGEWEFQADGGR